MFAAQQIAYHQTASFSKIVLDYLNEEKSLQPFYSLPPTIEGFKQAIKKRKGFITDRKALVDVLKDQYAVLNVDTKVQENIERLLDENTFTVTTAHQPNLFTGPLYFIYKILHAIKVAEELKKNFTDNSFVPVFYMGSEDADLAELNHFTVKGKRYEWNTDQKGAVGRMIIDKKITALIDELHRQLGVEAHGEEVVDLLKRCYKEGTTIQSATLQIVNELFGKFGLVILIADDARLKKQMISVFEDDIFHQKPSEIVSGTCEKLEELYKVQAHPRDINLFYLQDGMRERIEKQNDQFSILNSQLSFSEAEIKEELQNHPERFSPNVILRGLYQETILPNIAFIGGGGELAYWLQLKELFDHYNVPYPVLVLRNSVLIVEKHQNELIKKLNLFSEDLFQSELNILNRILEKEGKKPHLNGELDELQSIYDQLKNIASSIDPTLQQHVEALKTKNVNQLQVLEKKMLRAERKKHEAVQRQIAKLKQQLFPNNSLQERVENISGYYAKWGSGFVDELYKSSLSIEQQFILLRESTSA
jgi:bacillithiol synthase